MKIKFILVQCVLVAFLSSCKDNTIEEFENNKTVIEFDESDEKERL